MVAERTTQMMNPSSTVLDGELGRALDLLSKFHFNANSGTSGASRFSPQVSGLEDTFLSTGMSVLAAAQGGQAAGLRVLLIVERSLKNHVEV